MPCLLAHSTLPSRGVYAQGYNYYGQLGSGKGVNDIITNVFPNLVGSDLSTLTVVAVDGGSLHSLFLSSTGKVYASGYAGMGQLGFSDPGSYFRDTPTLVRK